MFCFVSQIVIVHLHQPQGEHKMQEDQNFQLRHFIVFLGKTLALSFNNEENNAGDLDHTLLCDCPVSVPTYNFQANNI